MKRTTKAEFEALIQTIESASAAERQSVAYYAALAARRQQWGSYVYVSASSPDYPTVLDVYVGRWGKSQNRYHSNVLVSAGKACFGAARCRALVAAAR